MLLIILYFYKLSELCDMNSCTRQVNWELRAKHSQNGNSDLGACSQVAVFVFGFIQCVRYYRTHSTAANEINVGRPLRHIYELSAWLVT